MDLKGDLKANLESNAKSIEEAFNRLEAEAKNWEVTRRGIVKEGVQQVLKQLQVQEKASIIFITKYIMWGGDGGGGVRHRGL